MKIARVREATGAVRVGAVGDAVVHVFDGVADIAPLLDAGGRRLEELGVAALRRADNVIALDDVTLLAPLATPPTVRDFYAFEDHVRAGRATRGLDMDPAWYEQPVFYFSNPYAVRGEGPVPVPPGCGNFDFELEVAAVVGAGGADLTPAQADALLAGFCVFNDWSARDIQSAEMRFSLGPVKGKDTVTSLGPWLVTVSELEEFRDGNGFDRAMTCEVNGRRYSSSRWSEVAWSFGEMAAFASRGTEIRPGDVLGSGTCGTGCILELSWTHSEAEYPWLVPGDTVDAAVEGLGVLRNVVVEGVEPMALRP